MMKERLILMRHAKSEWGDPAIADFDRPLNGRGRRDAPRMARWLARHHMVPDRILASTARRVQETVAGMLPCWDAAPAVLWSGDLYHASPEAILRHLASDGGEDSTVMIVAHNPGLELLVGTLAGEMIPFPTAAMAIFAVRGENWAQPIDRKKARLIAVQYPKELPADDQGADRAADSEDQEG